MTPIACHRLEIVAEVTDTIRRDDAAAALDQMRRDRPMLHDGAYHETRAVFMVWAVDRLVRAGLSSTAILWHPLLHEDSAYAWWSAEVLDSAAAAVTFVPSDLAVAGEPMPGVPQPERLAA